MVVDAKPWRGSATADADLRIDPRLKIYLKSLPDQTVLDIPQPGEAELSSRQEVLALRASQVRDLGPRFAASQESLKKNMTLPSAEEAAQWSHKGLDSTTHSFTSQPDGNVIKLLWVRPACGGGPLPLVYYMHGGGMRNQSAFDPQYVMWSRALARQGVAVALVDFRNSEVPSASNSAIAPYPAGLNDCYSGLVWCHDHATELNIDPRRIIVAGESGGGNLCIATALKAKREGRMSVISGVYALCPYIAGTWPQDVIHEGILGSSHLVGENNGYIIALGGTRRMSNAAVGYSAEAFLARDPLSWPGFASVEELRGLPRCVICVDECDPLRDEGINFYRRLLAANVKARCWQMMGCTHAAAVAFLTLIPDIGLDAVRSIADFARHGISEPSAKL